jgi:ribosomal protein S18 acetylase RimI-like enzyme
MTEIRIRPAGTPDAAAITILADIAGYCLPHWVWSNSPDRRPGESVLAFGRRRVLRQDSVFSYRKTFVADVDGEVAGMLLGYRQPDVAAPVGDDVPEPLRPLSELEALAPGTWYVNILSVFEEFQGSGIGRRLLEKADALAKASGARGLSIIVEDDNSGAHRLYRNAGYREIASRPFVPFPGCAPAENWILLVKAEAGG